MNKADAQRDKFVAEIRRCEEALKKTKSKYLKRDYQKALKRMRSELAEYDRFHGCRGSIT